jgi:hypothetical protein
MMLAEDLIFEQIQTLGASLLKTAGKAVGYNFFIIL